MGCDPGAWPGAHAKPQASHSGMALSAPPHAVLLLEPPLPSAAAPGLMQPHGWSVLRCVAQVILKPDPGNAQELYLGSLEALGIDTRAHDVRFVEDNWESPVLGAWGLGWEVRHVPLWRAACRATHAAVHQAGAPCRCLCSAVLRVAGQHA